VRKEGAETSSPKKSTEKVSKCSPTFSHIAVAQRCRMT
jgi:hypothetical protein